MPDGEFDSIGPGEKSGTGEEFESTNLTERSFASEFLATLRHDYMALFSLVAIGGLCFAAVFAPLLANGRPLLLRVGGIWASPAFSALFTPDSPEIVVEKTFNFLLLLIPCALLTGFPFRRKWKLLAALAILLAIPFVMSGSRLEKNDWREASAKLTAANDFMIFAPVRYGPFETAGTPYAKPSKAHILGCDHAGRDIFARMIYGARVSLAVGFAATGISLAAGALIGLLSGYFGGRFDLIVQRVVEIVICFPTFLLLLILMSIMLDYGFRQSILLVIAVIGLTGWTGLCRLVRGETLKQRALPYIQSCEAMGLPKSRIILRHLLPNVSSPIFVAFAFEIAGAILAESGLSFLGFGVQDPTSSWGELLRQATPDPVTYWHLTLWPGLAIFIAVCAFNFLGEALRKTLNPNKD
jgi:peptide/nickel transport system permease protein